MDYRRVSCLCFDLNIKCSVWNWINDVTQGRTHENKSSLNPKSLPDLLTTKTFQWNKNKNIATNFTSTGSKLLKIIDAVLKRAFLRFRRGYLLKSAVHRVTVKLYLVEIPPRFVAAPLE